MNIKDMLKKPGRFKAIIKDVAGRRMLLGFERASKRSRKSNIIHISKPVDMDTLRPKEDAK